MPNRQHGRAKAIAHLTLLLIIDWRVVLCNGLKNTNLLYHKLPRRVQEDKNCNSLFAKKMNSWPGLGQFDGWLSSVVSLTFAMYQIKCAWHNISRDEMFWLSNSLIWQYLQCNWLHCNCDAFFKTSRLHMIARCKSQHVDGLYWLLHSGFV